MRKFPKSLSALFLGALLGAAAVLTGCAYSTSQGRVDESIKQVHVEYLENLTAEPQIGVDLADLIVDAIQIDNTLRIVSQPNADAIISGRVTRYHLQEMGLRQDLTVNEYQIQIAVMLTFAVRSTGETLFKDRRFTGRGTYVLNDPTGQTSEDTARTEAGREIVKDILAIVVEDW
jgi:hypothetical protein